jgi:hypothetical protein
MSTPKTATFSPERTTTPGWYTDPGTGFVRWWNGHAFGVYQQTQMAPAQNRRSTAALVLGICGLVLMQIPLFIGWFAGGIPALLAIAFGILGISRARQLGGNGLKTAMIGLILGTLSIVTALLGAGRIW